MKKITVVRRGDPLTITAQTLTSIHRTTLAKDLETLLRLVEDHQVEELAPASSALSWATIAAQASKRLPCGTALFRWIVQ